MCINHGESFNPPLDFLTNVGRLNGPTVPDGCRRQAVTFASRPMGYREHNRQIRNRQYEYELRVRILAERFPRTDPSCDTAWGGSGLWVHETGHKMDLGSHIST